MLRMHDHDLTNYVLAEPHGKPIISEGYFTGFTLV